MTNIVKSSGLTDVILNGDLNWDPSRSTGFSTSVKSFVANLGLVPLWTKFPVEYTHIHTDLQSTSVLDHFLVSERLVALVEDCQVLHSGDNLSPTEAKGWRDTMQEEIKHLAAKKTSLA